MRSPEQPSFRSIGPVIARPLRLDPKRPGRAVRVTVKHAEPPAIAALHSSAPRSSTRRNSLGRNRLRANPRIGLLRHYNPETGRWLSRDPIEENGGAHLYAYVANNPVRWVDPTGEGIWDSILRNLLKKGRKKYPILSTSIHSRRIQSAGRLSNRVSSP